MSTNVVRTADSWWVEDGERAVTVPTSAATTADLIADRSAVDEAAALLAEGNGEPLKELNLLSPVTAPCRVVAQMVNYRSHARESGFDPDTVPPTFFRKSSASLSGPTDPIVRPDHVRFLDYEVELGLVIGRDIPAGSTIEEQDLSSYAAGLVVADDVSARDVQLTKTQFYESKSYPTFTPVGPRLVLLEPEEFTRLADLRLRLWVNGALRQDRTLADMIVRPLQALRLLSRFQDLAPGDLLLTGTPGGTALQAPPKVVEKAGALLPAATKWNAFFRTQTKNPRYLRHGDRVRASIATADGAIDLGTQVNAVTDA